MLLQIWHSNSRQKINRHVVGLFMRKNMVRELRPLPKYYYQIRNR